MRDNHASLLERFFASGHIPVGAAATADQVVQPSGELKMAAFDLKMVLADIKLEIGNLKNEVKELKDEVRKAKNPILFDNAAAIVLWAIFVAVLVAMLWKK